MTNFIWPPRTSDCIPPEEAKFYAECGWIAQLKFNDSHILADLDLRIHSEKPDKPVIWLNKVWDRHGAESAYDYINLAPELIEIVTKLNPVFCTAGRYLLDGGLLHTRHAAIKDTIVLWDILVAGNKHLLNTTYQERHELLLRCCTDEPFMFNGIKLGRKATANIFVPESYQPDLDPELHGMATEGKDPWHQIWADVHKANEGYEAGKPVIEGCVFKNPAGKLQLGLRAKNNDDWLGKSRLETKRHRF